MDSCSIVGLEYKTNITTIKLFGLNCYGFMYYIVNLGSTLFKVKASHDQVTGVKQHLKTHFRNLSILATWARLEWWRL